MNNKLLLIRSITLLYRASQLPIKAATNPALVKEVAESIMLPETVVGNVDSERELINGLKQIALGMVKNADSTEYVIDDLLQQVKMFTVHDESIFEILKEGIYGELNEKDLQTITRNIRQQLQDYLREVKAFELIKAANRKAAFKRDEIPKVADFIAELRTSLEQYEVSTKEVDPAIIGTVNLSNLESIVNVFTQAQELNDDKGIMKLGWQGINRMLQGGVRRGEFGVVGALQHNFKTGFSLSTFKQIAMYNTPYMLDPLKKPLLIRISFEDPLSLNMPFLYRNIKENESLEMVDVLRTPAEEMSKYVMEKLSVNGYEVQLLHVNPSLWGYRDIQNYILEMESQGYEVHALWLDYLNMMDKRGCDNNGPTGSNIRDLFRRMRNFCAPEL